MKKGKKLYSITHLLCARCQEEKLFRSGTYDLGNLFDMYEYCPKCGQKHELEIGFWWGGMYVGYGLSAAILLPITLISVFLFKMDLVASVCLAGAVVVLLAPLIFRISRAIWLNAFVHYDPNWSEKIKNEVKTDSYDYSEG